MAATARQKRSYLHHQGEFQLQNCTVGTVHDSDHEGVVRIFVGHSYHSNELFILHYAALYFLYQECKIHSARKQLLSKCYSNMQTCSTISVKSIRRLMVSLAPVSVIRSNAHRTQSVWDSGHARHYPEKRGGNCLPCLIASYALVRTESWDDYLFWRTTHYWTGFLFHSNNRL